MQQRLRSDRNPAIMLQHFSSGRTFEDHESRTHMTSPDLLQKKMRVKPRALHSLTSMAVFSFCRRSTISRICAAAERQHRNHAIEQYEDPQARSLSHFRTRSLLLVFHADERSSSSCCCCWKPRATYIHGFSEQVGAAKKPDVGRLSECVILGRAFRLIKIGSP